MSLKNFEQVDEILAKISRLDYPHERLDQIAFHLLNDPNAWWVEIGATGVLYLTGVMPSQNANVNVLFWDGQLTAVRRTVVTCVLATAFELFELPRITAFVHEKNNIQKVFWKKIGFVLEGALRRGARVEKGWEDLIMFGLLPEELPPCPRMKVEVYGSAS